MTLIVGARCHDGITLAADRQRLSKYEKGPETNKVFKLSCNVALAGAGDDAVLNEARFFIERKIEEFQSQSSNMKLFDIVEISCSVVNELVGYYRDKVEEPGKYYQRQCQVIHYLRRWILRSTLGMPWFRQFLRSPSCRVAVGTGRPVIERVCQSDADYFYHGF
jgi:hypothetical protein